MAEITECDHHDWDEFWDEFWQDTPQDAAPAPHFIICGRCDAVWTTGLVPADQAEQEFRAYLAADKDEQEDK